MNRILIFGNINSRHLIRVVQSIKSSNKSLKVDIYNTASFIKEGIDISCFDLIKTKKKNFYHFLYKIPVINFLLLRLLDPLKDFKSIPFDNYLLVNIHYLTIETFFLYKVFQKKARFIMISPWGSDIYRIKKFYYIPFKNVLRKSNYISALKIKFRYDIMAKFSIKESKFVELGFGSDIIDLINYSQDITRDDAKTYFKLDNKFVITCGYNGSRLQNHISIIKSIKRVRDFLPKETVLVLPVTYGADEGYIRELSNYLDNIQISYRLFDKFMLDKEIMYLRKCSDIFIHAQPTDAFSGSVQEYLLAGSCVINGIWTRYPDLEKYGIPYLIFRSFEELDIVLIDAIENGTSPLNTCLKKEIVQKGWHYQNKKWAQFFNNLTTRQ